MRSSITTIALLFTSLACTATGLAQTSNAYVIPSATNYSDGISIRPNTHYYTVYIDGSCINHDSTWLSKNLIAVTAKLEVNGKLSTSPCLAGLQENPAK